jgi:outer membrane protein
MNVFVKKSSRRLADSAITHSSIPTERKKGDTMQLVKSLIGRRSIPIVHAILSSTFLAMAALTCSTNASAQSAGTNVAQIGWIHVAPQDSSGNLNVGGTPVPDTGGGIREADTLGLNFAHFFTDNVAVEIAGGYPPSFTVFGKENLSVPSINPLGKIRQWAPAILVQYHFLPAGSKFRPYVGLGVSYLWFNNIRMNPAFAEALSSQITSGATAALPTRVTIDSQWSAVLNAGFNYKIDKHWSAGFSLSYLPVGTTANLTTQLPGGGAVASKIKVKLDPIVTFAGISYAF